jgi:uncharacterized membrane protein
VGGLTGGDDGDEEGEGAELDATGSGRRMPVQQAMDVAVPLEFAYNQWTQFEEYPNFMHRVDSASQEDDAHVKFQEKVWGFGRDFEAEIVEQRPNERITWRSESGLKHAGVVTFHRLADRLTRIEVSVDFKPESLFQKFARGTRFSKRAIRADMHRFKAYTELLDQEDGAWLGTIEGGEVVQEDSEAREEMESQTEGTEEEEQESVDEDRAASEDEDEASEEAQEPEAEEEPEETAEAEEEDEEAAEEDEDEQPEAEEEPEETAEADEEQEEAPQTRRRAQSSDGRGAQRSGTRRRRGAQASNGGGRKKPQRPRKPRTAASSR